MNATISRAAFKAVFTASKKLGKNRWLILDGQHLYATDTDVWIIIPYPSPITGRIDHRAVDVSDKGETIIVPLMDDITLDDCPMMPAHDALKTFAFDPAAFTRTLDQVAVHASTNKSRMTLNNVYMELLPGTIRLTAADGHRLAVRELIATTSLTESAIVPLDAMLIALPAMKRAVKQELPVSVALLYDNVKSTNTKTGEASSTPTLNRVRFTAGPTTIISRVTDGPYFNIDKLNIYRAPNTIRVNRAAMLAAVENTQGLPSKGEKSTYIKLAINDVLTINGMGDALSIAIMDKHGDDAVIGLDRAYLLDALNTLVDDEITIGYGETLDRVCFYGADKAVNVVMPAKV